MAKGKGPDEARVDELYAKLYGTAKRGEWKGKERHEVQQLVYIEDSCRTILASIEAIRKRSDDDEGSSGELIGEVLTEFHFLMGLAKEKDFLRTLRFMRA